MNVCKVLVLILIATLSVISPIVHALKLTPSNFELKPKGSGSSFVFSVENEQDSLIAVEVRIFTRELGEGNVEVNADASSLFEIFPSQIILPGGSEKKLRIRWIGGGKLDSERAFRLHVSQLPVSFSKEKEDTAIKVLHKVIGALYVTPSAAVSELSVVKASKKGDRLVFVVKNKGSKHSLLSEHEVIVEGDTKVPLNSVHLGELTTQNILAKSSLIVDIPWPKSAGEVLKSVNID